MLRWHEPAPVGAPPTRLFQTGFQRLGLRVPDLDGALVRVGALGGAVWSEPVTHTLPAGGDCSYTGAVQAGDRIEVQWNCDCGMDQRFPGP